MNYYCIACKYVKIFMQVPQFKKKEFKKNAQGKIQKR